MLEAAISTDTVEKAIMEIVQGVYVLVGSEVDSQIIGEMVMEKLIEIDDVAYIRFASVYRQFRDIHDFFEEVRPILDKHQLQMERQNRNQRSKDSVAGPSD